MLLLARDRLGRILKQLELAVHWANIGRNLFVQ